MRWIDQFAYGNRISRLNPAIKVGLSLIILLAALIASNVYVSFGLLILVILLVVFWAKLPIGSFIKILFGESTFLLFAVVGIAVSISTIPSEGAWHFLGLWFVVTQESLWLAFNLFLRAVTCTAAMNFMAMTTPITDIIYLFTRLHIPRVLIDIMTLIYRFTFTLFDCFTRMVTAKEARLGFRTLRQSLRSWADIGTNLFIEAFRRSQKLEIAMQSRCWEGDFRVLPPEYQPIRWPWQRKRSQA